MKQDGGSSQPFIRVKVQPLQKRLESEGAFPSNPTEWEGLEDFPVEEGGETLKRTTMRQPFSWERGRLQIKQGDGRVSVSGPNVYCE